MPDGTGASRGQGRNRSGRARGRFDGTRNSDGQAGEVAEKAPAAMCRKMAIAKLTGNHQIEIWGDGEQTRSFCYIDDCLECISG